MSRAVEALVRKQGFRRLTTKMTCGGNRRFAVLLVASILGLAACAPVQRRSVNSTPQPGSAPSAAYHESLPSTAGSGFPDGSAVYDADHNEVLFLRLVQGARTAMLETWVWRGGSWRQLHPAHSPTPPRVALLMYDPGTHQVLIEGGDYWTPSSPPSPVPCSRVVKGPKNFADGCSVGTVSTGRNYDDTWAWDGADWHQLHPAYAPKVVSPWVGGAYFYDGRRHRLIADFGGPYPAMAGLYSWDGRTWTRVRPKNVPGVEASQPGFPSDVIAVDPVAGTVVVYTGQRASDCQGGLGLACFSAVSETLVGDGLSWSKLAGPEPEPEWGKLISDPVDGGVLLLNELGHTWILRNGHWYQADTDGPHPSIRSGFLYTDGMAVYFQPELGVPGSRWGWDGQRWRTVG